MSDCGYFHLTDTPFVCIPARAELPAFGMRYPGSIRVDDNMYVPMLSDLAEAIHRYGAKCTINISPGGGAERCESPSGKGERERSRQG